ncbi:MAG TPA: hypothetical protein VFT22_07560 [Kofleriaceae bacterium]|nr:hypothetical protein [Kofleriaceae bacterium]
MSRFVNAVDTLAHEMCESADGFMRASTVRLKEAGDTESADRAAVIAVREYEWSAKLWDLLGNHEFARKCRGRAEAARLGTWTDPALNESQS